MIGDAGAVANGKFGTGLCGTEDGLYLTAPGGGTLHRFAWADAEAESQQAAEVVAG